MQILSVFFCSLLAFSIAFNLYRAFISKDKAQIWAPTTIISLVLIYYVIIPSALGLTDYNASGVQYQYKFYLASFIFYSCVIFAFHSKFLFSRYSFSKCNKLFTDKKAWKFAIALFLIALICYVPFKGFRYNISAEDVETIERQGFISYFIDLISLLVAASALAFVSFRTVRKCKKYTIVFLVILYFSLVLFVIGGFRYRIVLLVLSLSTIFHLCPKVSNIKLKLLVPIGLIVYLGFAVMDVARVYGAGINLDSASDVSFLQATSGAHEHVDVCCYSIRVVNDCSEYSDYVYFEPIITAIFMPIPRSLFPSKPDGSYLTKYETRIIGGLEGAVVLCYVESFMAFGWIGVVVYGLFVGIISKMVWLNYKDNRNSIGALLLLSLFNGFCYQWIARGYMASAFNDFMYFVVLPFWFSFVLKRKIS